MSTEHGGSFDELNPAQEIPELAEYFQANSETEPSTVLVLPQVPRLIGGVKSRKFIVQAPQASPDTPPDPSKTIDLSGAVVHSQGVPAFINFFETTEAQAERQYPAALFETQQVLAEAEARGNAISMLFVPDTVNSTAIGYFRRLTRLAQNTGVRVATHVRDDEDGEIYSHFKQFEPPRAASVEAYWAGRAQEVTQFAPQEVPPEPADEDALQALANITPEPEDPAQDFSLHYALKTAAAANPAKLRAWLLDPASPLRITTLPIVQNLAYGKAHVRKYNQALARVIVAKLDDQKGYEAISRELRDQTGGYGYESLTMVPLGVYLRQDPVLFTHTMERVDRIITDNPRSSQLISLLGALHHSHDLRVGMLMADKLAVPAENTEVYTETVLSAIMRWLPEYTAIVQAMPPSAQQQATLEAIQKSTLTFLDDLKNDKIEPLIQRRILARSGKLVAMLLRLRNPANGEILRRLTLSLFEERGSIIMDNDFERQYLQYREQYGDLPEISQHIHINH